MEHFLVKQVKVSDLKCGDEFCIPGEWTKISIIELIEYMKANNPDDIVLVKLPSPDILIPSEEYLDLAITEGECGDDWDDIQKRQLAISYGCKWANWALSRLKELNPNINFKIK